MAKNRRPSAEELSADVASTGIRWENGSRAFCAFAKWGALVLVAYILAPAIIALAGKETSASLGLDLFASLAQMPMTKSIPWMVATAGMIWGLVERRGRRVSTRNQSQQIELLEKAIDPNRLSSGVNRDGTSNPKDTW